MKGARSALPLEIVTPPAFVVSGSAMGFLAVLQTDDAQHHRFAAACRAPTAILQCRTGFCAARSLGLERRHVQITNHASVRRSLRGHQGPPLDLRPDQRTGDGSLRAWRGVGAPALSSGLRRRYG